MEEGLLSLKWNNHKSTFFTVLSLLREKHTYTDVTLACEGRLYPAHRFVLSTCSEYFAEIFSSTTGNNIVIVLKDVRRADLEYLLDYMYLGQVDVAQSELASLIKTAECLRIKGLAIPDDEPPKTLMPRRQGDHREREASPPSKRKRSQVEEDRGESASNSSNNSSRNGASQHVVGSSSSGSSSQRLPPPSSSSQSQSLSSAQSSQAPTLTTKTSSSSLSSRLAPPQPSGRHTPTSPQPPLTSPTGHSHPSTPAAVIKQEVTEPPDTPEISYLSESFEEPETKPNVGDQEMSMAGPSGLQGGSEVWDGDTDLSGFTGDNYSGEGCEDGTDSEAQGGSGRIRVKSRSELGLAFTTTNTAITTTSTTSAATFTNPGDSIKRSPLLSQSPLPSYSLSPKIVTMNNLGAAVGLGGGCSSNISVSPPLHCRYCSFVAATESVLLHHLLTHTGVHSGVVPAGVMLQPAAPRLYHCSGCPYSATQWESVRRHAWRQHRTEMEIDK